jgi:hypothetical protein
MGCFSRSWLLSEERRPHIENDPRGTERVFANKSFYNQSGTPLP